MVVCSQASDVEPIVRDSFVFDYMNNDSYDRHQTHMSTKPEIGKGERIGAANLLRLVRRALWCENVKGVRYDVAKKSGALVLSLYGTEVDRFLAEQAIHKHSSPHPIRPSRRS